MPTPTPFLRLVARAFLDNCGSELRDYCFVFPSRRSGVFFTRELCEQAGKEAFILPEVTTIAQMVSDLTGSVEVSRIEALLILYQQYAKIKGEHAESFDRFLLWADTILNDFNDVDKYMVDARQIFGNVKDLKQIQSTYLNREQIEAIEQYFGKGLGLEADDEHLWRQVNPTHEFSRMWDMLYPLYQNFNQALDELGMTYSGRMYRQAVAQVKEMAQADFGHIKYVFVGFNALSTSEYHLFKALAQRGMADFYWDYNSPTFDNPHNKANYFMRSNLQHFKPALDLHEPHLDTYPQLRAVGVPSNVGQAKYCSAQVEKLIENHSITDVANASNTAIVLPDELMLIPLLDSLTPKIENFNITMGYPLRYTDVATLISTIARLHKNARFRQEKLSYFHEDLRELVAHPLLQLAAAQEGAAILEYITDNNLFYIEYEYLQANAPSLDYILRPVKRTTTACLIEYIRNIVAFAEQRILERQLVPEHSLEMGFISAYMDQLNLLAASIEHYSDITLDDNTFFYLVDRIVSSASVAFEGEPLRGLQIMGILETRCLDFEHVIIMSMNERIFPRKHYSRSFIPHTLRKAYGMATVEYQECMYAYYFYRLISRARTVTMLYDSRTESLSSGEPSRFVFQLQKLFPQSGIVNDHLRFEVKSPVLAPLVVYKNERIMKVLDQYRTPDSGHYLSASTINHYINCPLAFYFEKVEKLQVPDEMTEFMDAGTMGTVVHEVMQQLYSQFGRRVKDDIVIVDEATIGRMLGQADTVRKIINRTINKEYLRIDNDSDTKNGETHIVATGIHLLVDRLLDFDRKQLGQGGSFTILQTELPETMHWDMGQGVRVNIKQLIDRVDRLDAAGEPPQLRIIDYKTGSDETNTGSVAQMFNAKASKRPKALLQLMLYCNVYQKLHPTELPVKPIIYKLRNISESGFKVNRATIDDYHSINDEYLDHLRQVIAEIFDPQVPFTQAQNEKNCDYCKFTNFCRK